MSEELEKKNMPKATLIKHKKPTAESDASKTEKKKVVVVKKKKKPAAKAVPSSDKTKQDGVKPVAKAAVNSDSQKTSGARTPKGERPAGGSRKGRSQDDIFAGKPAVEEAASVAEVKPAPAPEAVKIETDVKSTQNRGSDENRTTERPRQEGAGRPDTRPSSGSYQGRPDNRQGGG
ncbi:MAG TPA: hypothetical protein DCO79_09205, partial [Spirochaeta sp.]|nr:hypothetical protein [Spirochaeta sp.]